MDAEKIVKELTFEEKTKLLTGVRSMNTYAIDRLSVKSVRCAEGPHGVRIQPEANCTHFPNVCNLSCSWDKETAREMGRALADECIKHHINVLLAPGVNLKRHILCGRNFEYFSEDPVLAGELAAAYIEGLQEKGVSACLKHFAVNNQEEGRLTISVEIDERTLRELYLKAFEIVVKKAKPDSIMCAYNKINGIWCSENHYLLTEILKDEWGFDGVVFSDWGAVQNPAFSVKAGLDLQMPDILEITEMLRDGIEKGWCTEADIDRAAKKVIEFADREPLPEIDYDRDKQHAIARKIAADGIVLLKNDNDVLPLTSDKYKKIAVVGGHAVEPLVSGQGAADVFQSPEYTLSPLDELKKQIPDIEFKHIEIYKAGEYNRKMLWPRCNEFKAFIEDCDAVLYFGGSMVSEDTENFDRLSASVNPNQELFVRYALEMKKKVIVVLQNGGALVLGENMKKADSIVEMWLGGEAAGGAIADVLCGKVNPSGKLSETFPRYMRHDMDYTGSNIVEYSEKFDIGYRYYDKHPEEILYPFGHGISYTTFEYKDLKTDEENLTFEFTLKNTGNCDGAEIVQLYVGDPVANVIRPIKELKKFEKVSLKAGEETKVSFTLTKEDLSYYNPNLREWVAENGEFDIYIGASSRDIKFVSTINYKNDMPYSLTNINDTQIG